MIIGQCSRNCWIIVWQLFKNVKIEHEWTLYTYTICIFFHVLILKVVAIYFKPSLTIVLKESKCMCMSYIIINPWPSWIEIYEYFNTFINLCTSIDVWCIRVDIKHKIWDIWRLWSWLMFFVMLVWRSCIHACITTWELCKFFNWKTNGIQVAIVFNLFILHVLFDPHKNFHVG